MVTQEALGIGEAYYTVFFAPDSPMTEPIIETFIYIGRADSNSLSLDHVFQTARSFHQVGNWNRMSEAQRKEFPIAPLLIFDMNNLEPLFDSKGLIEEIKDAHSRK
jgi:hypothetical protein